MMCRPVKIVLYISIAIPYDKDTSIIHRIDLAVRFMTGVGLKDRQNRQLPRVPK